jgi:uncharacterized protein (TIGR00255 family)
MRSMTGFGRAEGNVEGVHLVVQVSSQNRKQADVRVSLPGELAPLEREIWDLTRARVSRGAVHVRIDTSGSAGNAVIQRELATACVQQLCELRDALGLSGDLTIHDLLAIPDLITIAPSDASTKGVAELTREVLCQALDSFDAMRSDEGRVLRGDLESRVGILRDLHANIAAGAPAVGERLRERLLTRVRDLVAQIDDNDERFLKEVAVLLDRADISEEITRLDAHLAEIAKLMTREESIGRKLVFLIQETQREINTIGSKANDITLSHAVVEFKAELERIREQAQNIE